MNLIELSKECQALDNLLAMVTDTESPEVQEAIARLLDFQGQQVEKVGNYLGLIREFQLRRDARRAEADRLADLATHDDAKADRLIERLHFAMKAFDKTKIETPRGTVARVNVGGKLKLEIEGSVPPEYQKTEIVTKPDNDKIRGALEAGEPLEFAKLAPRGERLSIK